MPSLNFPTPTTVGEQYLDWVWNGVGWDSLQTLPGGLPAGSIIQWGGSTAPVNWLLCDGSAVSRTTYASLFAAVGTAYGTGDGTTTFNLPDLRGRVPVGKNGGSFGTLGATGGAETVTLTEAQMPSHTHIQNSHNHTQDSHGHISGANTATAMQYVGSGGNSNWNFGGGSNAQQRDMWPATATNQPTTATNQNTGGGQAHNNLQPYQVVNYIIKATAAVTPGESELAPRVGVLEVDVLSLEGVRPVSIGGTGATSLTSGSYLKGAGTSAITAQAGIPAGDITSGTISTDRLPTVPAAKMPSGSILQVVTSGTSANTATVSGGYSWGNTGLSAALTPVSTSSRVKVSVNIVVSCSAAGWVFMRILRNGSPVASGTTGGTFNFNSLTYIQDYGRLEPINSSIIDSPGTTSSVTYSVQFAVYTGTGYLNRRGADALFGAYSNMIIEEIA